MLMMSTLIYWQICRLLNQNNPIYLDESVYFLSNGEASRHKDVEIYESLFG